MLNVLGVVLREGMFSDDTRSDSSKDLSGCLPPTMTMRSVYPDFGGISPRIVSYGHFPCFICNIGVYHDGCDAGRGGFLEGMFVESLCKLPC